MREIISSGIPLLHAHMTITSVIDILAVAILVYELLLIVRGTRAAQILAGIGTLTLIYGLSVYAHLEALRSLLSYLVPYFPIAVIILFQSEIRRTLARIGRKRVFGSGFRRLESVDEILLAMTIMSQDRVGA